MVAAVGVAAVGEAASTMLTSRGESSFGAAVKTASWHTGIVTTIARTHWRIRRSSSTQTRRQSISGLRTTKTLRTRVTRSGAVAGRTTAKVTRTRTRGTSHRRRSHAVRARSLTRLAKAHGRSGTRSTAAQTADVLGKVVVVATISSAAPIAGTERDTRLSTSATHTTTHTVTMTVAVTVSMSTVSAVAAHMVAWVRHHSRVSIAITAIDRLLVVAHGWVGASEAGSATLEV